MILKNKTVLITGIGKGIGETTCRIALEEGAFVYGITRTKKDIQKFKNHTNLKAYVGDTSNINLLKRILNDSIRHKRLINGIVNNAGVRFRKKFLKISKYELQQVFNNNFFSIFFLTQFFLKNSLQKKNIKSIVNVSSIVGKNGFEELSGYASTKSALVGLGKSLAVEFGGLGVRTNTINPGFIKTSYYQKFKKNSKIYNWTLSRTPIKRWGEPNEVSRLIVFLLSDKSSYINGEDINIDGGWLSS
ncbi:SDR family oxidoreductase [Candidatus Pelagibacter sp.]|nr:SDR family oxidoreductase [Candidatus Pelagibacter sp.]